MIASNKRRVFAALGIGAACVGVAALGVATMRGRGAPSGRWYRSLRKPAANPPNAVFAPVWTVLYGLIAYSGWRIWNAPPSRARSRALALWAAQLALNGAWTPLFFGARRPRAALLDLVALDAAATGYVAAASCVDRQAAVAVLPYLGWISFATYLNAAILRRNPNI